MTAVATIASGLFFRALNAESIAVNEAEAGVTKPALLIFAGTLGLAVSALFLFVSGFRFSIVFGLFLAFVSLLNVILCASFSVHARLHGEEDGKVIGFLLAGMWVIGLVVPVFAS